MENSFDCIKLVNHSNNSKTLHNSSNLFLLSRVNLNLCLVFLCFAVLVSILSRIFLKSSSVNHKTDLIINKIEFQRVITYVFNFFSRSLNCSAINSETLGFDTISFDILLLLLSLLFLFFKSSYMSSLVSLSYSSSFKVNSLNSYNSYIIIMYNYIAYFK